MSQTRTHFLEGRKREVQVSEQENVKCHNKDSLPGEEWIGKLGNMAHYK